MEIHAHSHTERKRWTHYFWEFFMLFLAVTLGFFVENQREHFVEHKKEKEYMRSVMEGLRLDTAKCQSVTFKIAGTLTDLKSFSIVAPSGNPDLISEDKQSINELIVRSHYIMSILIYPRNFMARLRDESLQLMEIFKKEYHLK
jgi:hypothetical protein